MLLHYIQKSSSEKYTWRQETAEVLCKSEVKYRMLYARATLKKLLRDIKSAPLSMAGGNDSSSVD